MNYKQAMEYLEGIGQRGSIPGLDSIRELCERLGNPQKELSFIHIAGTNGKGSTLAFLSTVLKEAGYKTGRFISPTIFEYRERIQINGHIISQVDFCTCLAAVQTAAEAMAAEGMKPPTQFEIDTAMAFLYFQKSACDVVVLETGLGGTLDATNIVENTLVAVITPISMDHMDFLGQTPAAIAEHKAGIIKPGCHVVSAPQSEKIADVIEEHCRQKDCSLVLACPEQAAHIKYGCEEQKFSYQKYHDIVIRLSGKHQIENAVLALTVIEVLQGAGYPVSEKQLRKGFAAAVWPGRFQVIAKKPLFIVDGAHNEDGARRLSESIRFYFPQKRIIYIMGILQDKEYIKMIRSTYKLAEQIITVTPPGPRGMPALQLALEVQKYHSAVTAADSLDEAVELSFLLADKNTVIIAFGSLSYLGGLIKKVENRHMIRRDSHGRSKKNRRSN